MDESARFLASPFARVARSTTDRAGRIKLEVAGPHAGSEWIVVVMVSADAFVITVYEVHEEQDEEDV